VNRPHGDRTTVVERTTVLPAPPAAVFAAVNSPEIAPIIDPAVRRWEPDTDPIGVGTRFAIRGRLGRLPIRGTSETRRWEPPHLSAFESVKPSWPFRMTAEHRFEPHGDDATRYTWSITFHERNVVARPLMGLASRLFRSALADQAAALDAYLRGTA
jgi:hypothetical protein